MQKLKIEIENCYGIKKLSQEFDFTNFRTVVIYAPNGVMKTSLAKTFKDISNGDTPCDQMDETLSSLYDLLVDDTDLQIDPKEICVIEPYNEGSFRSEDKILTLLADEDTRNEYLEIYNEIESLKKATISGLKKISGSSNYEAEIIESFSNLGKENIFEIFDEILDEVRSFKGQFNIKKYNEVFDPDGKVRKFLEQNFSLLKQYIEKYNDLLSKSSFFSTNSDSIFGTTEAKNLDKSLEGDEYFIAGHKLSLKSHGVVSGKKELSDIISKEIAQIFNDEELKKTFEKIDKALSANISLSAFKKVIERDPSILVRLEDYDAFRRDVWLSYLTQIETGLGSLVDLYNDKKSVLKKIIQKAKDSQSAWESAIEEFQNRFVDMPFSITIKNKADAVLNAQSPAIDFQFRGKNIERKRLVENILSQGEKRAFYLLNIIFEIKSRQLQNQKTLFVIDDIADSFDYKNKYAIVEYLNDLTRDQNFYSIILTHNFDFFRTIRSRILYGGFKGSHSFIAEKLTAEIRLTETGNSNITDPFTSWKTDVHSNEKHLVACIPFVRNLIDFKEGKSDGYLLLTHVLHYKEADTANNIKATTDMSIGDLEAVFLKVLLNSAFTIDKTKKVVDVIDNLIADIKSQPNSESIILEDKIILAIGIRLKAELYMWAKVSDKSAITGSQTGKLFQRYKDEFSNDVSHREAVKTLESVNIMTPENIHLNSFMYEPIIDMGIDELKNLHDKVLQLK